MSRLADRLAAHFPPEDRAGISAVGGADSEHQILDVRNAVAHTILASDHAASPEVHAENHELRGDEGLLASPPAPRPSRVHREAEIARQTVQQIREGRKEQASAHLD